MLLTTIENIPGKRIVKCLGIVKGNTVRARHIGRDIMAVLKNIIGGEIKSYSDLLAASREEAQKRMIREAEQLGANAIIGIRFSTSFIMQSSAEILAYGTAVVLEDEH